MCARIIGNTYKQDRRGRFNPKSLYRSQQFELIFVYGSKRIFSNRGIARPLTPIEANVPIRIRRRNHCTRATRNLIEGGGECRGNLELEFGMALPSDNGSIIFWLHKEKSNRSFTGLPGALENSSTPRGRVM